MQSLAAGVAGAAPTASDCSVPAKKRPRAANPPKLPHLGLAVCVHAKQQQQGHRRGVNPQVRPQWQPEQQRAEGQQPYMRACNPGLVGETSIGFKAYSEPTGAGGRKEGGGYRNCLVGATPQHTWLPVGARPPVLRRLSTHP